MGAEGAILCDGAQGESVAAFQVDVVDSTAAGDAFCGAFAAALEAGHDLHMAMRWGNGAGALACTRAGAQPSLPDQAAIKALIG